MLNKKLKLSVICIFAFSSIMVLSCKKSNNSDLVELPDLTQSLWNGILFHNENGQHKEINLNVAFKTNSNGDYFLLDAPEIIKVKYVSEAPISYKKDGKNLHIDGGFGNILIGDWLAIKNNKNELMLVREIQNPIEADTLKLKKN